MEEENETPVVNVPKKKQKTASNLETLSDEQKLEMLKMLEKEPEVY